MYRKNYGKTKPKTRDYMDKTSYISEDLGRPENTKEGSVSVEISEKSLRNLPKSTYSFQADPYTASLPGSKPYPILAKFNRKIGGKYKGLKNIDGGNVQQYANSLTSGMLKYCDFIYSKLPLNYRNLPINLKATEGTLNPTGDYPGYYLIDEMRKSIAEATSVLQSTTFTQMAINNFGIITDLPMGSAIAGTYTDEHGQTVKVYDNLADVIYGTSIFYQLVLQAGLNIFNWHNSLRLKMGTMIRRSWNRETPQLNALFGSFKKKSFLSFMDSIALSFEGEYIDREEMQQINMLTLAPSARSNALTDPVLELAVQFNFPSVFKIVNISRGSGTVETLFDYAHQEAVTDENGDPVLDNNNNPVMEWVGDMVTEYKVSSLTTKKDHYFNIINDVIDKISAEKIMNWARDGSTSASSATGYFDKVKWLIDGINKCLTSFKTKMGDIREVFDTMSRTGTVNWEKGYVPQIVKDTDADIFDNLIINDIYRIMASSSNKVEFDEATKRWRTYSLWNMYDGIPEYDTFQGGSFLTLSLKNLDYSNDSDDVHKYLPIRFTAYDGVKTHTETVNGASTEVLDDYRNFVGSCRDGQEIHISGVTEITMSNDSTLARLAPLSSQSGLKIRVPDLTDVGLDTMTKSCAYKILTQIFGLCRVKLVNNTDVSLDPDIIAIYQIELEDITNEAVTYARSHAPFKGTVSTVDIIGFSK